MKKHINLFLFGAGAAIDWGGPTTNELTELVVNNGFKTVGSEDTITRFIYETLNANRENSNSEINFETIIN